MNRVFTIIVDGSEIPVRSELVSWLFKTKLCGEWLTSQINKLRLNFFPSLFTLSSVVFFTWQAKHFFSWYSKSFPYFSLCRAKEYETSMEAKTQVPDSPYKAKYVVSFFHNLKFHSLSLFLFVCFILMIINLWCRAAVIFISFYLFSELLN